MIEEHDYTILGLSAYYCDINLTEYIWAEFKQYVYNHNTTEDIGMSNLFSLS